MSDRNDNLIVHIVFVLDYGGLENGVVNVVNSLQNNPYRHAIVALTTATDFRKRLLNDVRVYELGKRAGKDLGAYMRLYRLLRRLQPAVVHTRNIGTLDCAFVAFMAGVPVRIHGEHGWDICDRHGDSRKYRYLRRVFGKFVHRFIAVSEELERWLSASVGISAAKITKICNGVDTERFRPLSRKDLCNNNDDSPPSGEFVIGSVTRFSVIKNPLNLVTAFIGLVARPELSGKDVRLIMIGNGELHARAAAMLSDAGLSGAAWLPGSRDDIPEQLRRMSVFVLGSDREGISNTILEAMACGLPVVATSTGGNVELVVDGENGALVEPGDSKALEKELFKYAQDRRLVTSHGSAARRRVKENYALGSMLNAYSRLYVDAMTTGEI